MSKRVQRTYGAIVHPGGRTIEILALDEETLNWAIAALNAYEKNHPISNTAEANTAR